MFQNILGYNYLIHFHRTGRLVISNVFFLDFVIFEFGTYNGRQKKLAITFVLRQNPNV
jgi:hypothetical protein